MFTYICTTQKLTKQTTLHNVKGNMQAKLSLILCLREAAAEPRSIYHVLEFSP